jgi:hypothetical protein
MSSEQTIRVLMHDETLGIPVFKEVPVLQSQERKWTEEEKEFQKKQLLYVIGLILIVILFIYVAVSGGILQVIIVIIGTIVLTPIIFFIWVSMLPGTKRADGTIDHSGDAAAIIFFPIVAVCTFIILTIIMAIYNFTTPTPTPSTIV